jgi:hypothetical protein
MGPGAGAGATGTGGGATIGGGIEGAGRKPIAAATSGGSVSGDVGAIDATGTPVMAGTPPGAVLTAGGWTLPKMSNSP